MSLKDSEREKPVGGSNATSWKPTSVNPHEEEEEEAAVVVIHTEVGRGCGVATVAKQHTGSFNLQVL